MAHTSGVLASPPSTTLARKDVGRDPHYPTIIVGGAETNGRAGPARYEKNSNTACQGERNVRAIRDRCSTIVRGQLPRCSFATPRGRSLPGERRARDRATGG